MHITIDQQLFHLLPNLKLGINYYTKTTVSASPQMLKGRLQLFQEQLYFELLDKPATEFEGIAEWRSVWSALGADPDTSPQSTEALLSRIQTRDFLASFHSAVDLNNFFSLQYEVPIAIYDADKLTGNIVLSLGTADDGYEGLNGQFNTFPNLLLLSDDYSPFGSPYVDSIRTAVTEESRNVLQLIFIRPSMDPTEALQLVEACGNMFTSINGGDVQSAILHKDLPSYTLEANL